MMDLDVSEWGRRRAAAMEAANDAGAFPPPRHNAPLCDPADVAFKHAPSADERQIGGDHYKQLPIQPWDVMQAVLTPEEFVGFLRGNVIKYSMRAGRKPGADDDAEKARHYIQKLQEVGGGW